MSILVVGSVALDSVKTPFGQVTEVLGGSATFFSLAARYYVPVGVVAVVGEDFPQAHLDLLRRRQIDLAGLEVKPGRTFRWRGEYGYDLNAARTLETQLNVFEGFRPRLPAAARSAEVVFLANIDPDLQWEVLQQVSNGGATPPRRLIACDTMDYWIEGKRDALLRVLHAVDILLINAGEARALGGEVNVVRAARAILQMGPKTVVIKRGEYGALMFHGRSVFAAPAYPLEQPLDPTGAGDSFAGGFMGCLARRRSLDPRAMAQAVIHGSVLASFAVETFSVERLNSLTQEAIEQHYHEFLALTVFED